VTRRPARIPPTFSDKVRRLAAVATEHVEGDGGIYRMSVAHDDDCPTLRTQSLSDCTCEPEFRTPERVA